MDAAHVRIDELMQPGGAFRADLRVRARSSRAEAWVELQSERLPTPGLLHVLQRRSWNQLIASGSQQVSSWIDVDSEQGRAQELEGWLVPVWRGDNDIEDVVEDGWGPAAVLLADLATGPSGEPVQDELFIDEMLPGGWENGLPAAYRIRWMRQPVLRLVRTEDAGAGVVERAGAFALEQIPVDTLVAVTDIRPLDIGSPPAVPLPGYTERLVPVDGLLSIDGLAAIRGGVQQRLDGLVDT